MSGKGFIPEGWLLDAPMFVDAQRIASLYNAIALPEYEEPDINVSISNLKLSKWEAGGEVEVSAADSLIAKLLLPFGLSARANASRGGEAQNGTGQTVSLRPVKAPERQLLNLAIHYGAHLQERVWTISGTADDSWLRDTTFLGALPKALVFIDFEPGTPFVPMAAELSDGKVVQFFDRLAEAAARRRTSTVPPDYPQSDDPTEMNHFWAWFQEDPHSSIDAMKVVEQVIDDAGRPQWVDYRVPIGSPGSQTRSLHLNIKARGIYDTGDFAYLLLRRGRKHGVRVVGTLKSGPGLNVLAIYEK